MHIFHIISFLFPCVVLLGVTAHVSPSCNGLSKMNSLTSCCVVTGVAAINDLLVIDCINTPSASRLIPHLGLASNIHSPFLSNPMFGTLFFSSHLCGPRQYGDSYNFTSLHPTRFTCSVMFSIKACQPSRLLARIFNPQSRTSLLDTQLLFIPHLLVVHLLCQTLLLRLSPQPSAYNAL